MISVSDHTLTEDGLDARGSDPARVLVLACGALAREILALFKINKWDHMDLTCLPAKWHDARFDHGWGRGRGAQASGRI